MAYPVFGSPIEISAEERTLKPRRKKPLHIAKGGVFIPRRYGPMKRLVVAQVYENAFDALRSRQGVSAYYGRPGHGALFRTQTVVARLHTEAAQASGDKAAFLSALAKRFEEGVYAKGRLLSRVEVWHNALLLTLAADLRLLRRIRQSVASSRDQGVALLPNALRALAAGLRLAPFVGLKSGIRNFVDGNPDDVVVFSKETHGAAADNLIAEIDGYLLRAEFEQAHCEAKTIERGMVDDAGRRLNAADGSFYGRFIIALLPALKAVGERMSEEHQKEAVASIVESMRAVYRALNTIGLTRETLDLFLKARGLMKALSESIG
jgi:hypothetical protein